MLRAVRSGVDRRGLGRFRLSFARMRKPVVPTRFLATSRIGFSRRSTPAARLDDAKIHSAVIVPRLEEFTAEGRTFAWNGPSRRATIPLACRHEHCYCWPCGSGKTFAAWRWVAARMPRTTDSSGHLPLPNSRHRDRGLSRTTSAVPVRRLRRRVKSTARLNSTWNISSPTRTSKSGSRNPGSSLSSNGQAHFLGHRRSVLGVSPARLRLDLPSCPCWPTRTLDAR